MEIKGVKIMEVFRDVRRPQRKVDGLGRLG